MREKVLMCRDFGLDCPAEFHGATVEDILEQVKKHGMEVHGQTKEQVESEQVMKIVAEKTRDDSGS